MVSPFVVQPGPSASLQISLSFFHFSPFHHWFLFNPVQVLVEFVEDEADEFLRVVLVVAFKLSFQSPFQAPLMSLNERAYHWISASQGLFELVRTE